MKLDSLNNLLLEEMADVYSAEQQVLKAMPTVIDAAQHPELKAALEEHRQETQTHVERLEALMERMPTKPPKKTCKGMEGLVKEWIEMAKQRGDPAVIDAGLIGGTQRVEHYEIAAYGCARTYATLLGETYIAAELDSSLEEEKAADAKLTELAMQVINIKAVAV